MAEATAGTTVASRRIPAPSWPLLSVACATNACVDGSQRPAAMEGREHSVHPSKPALQGPATVLENETTGSGVES